MSANFFFFSIFFYKIKYASISKNNAIIKKKLCYNNKKIQKCQTKTFLLEDEECDFCTTASF